MIISVLEIWLNLFFIYNFCRESYDIWKENGFLGVNKWVSVFNL